MPITLRAMLLHGPPHFRSCLALYWFSAPQDSLGGNAKTVIVANVNPAAACLRESQSTLAFAQRAKQVVNKAVINEAAQGELAALTKENARLRRELHLVNDTCRALQQVWHWRPEHAPALACTCCPRGGHNDRELHLVTDTCRALQQVRDWRTGHAPAPACTCCPGGRCNDY